MNKTLLIFLVAFNYFPSQGSAYYFPTKDTRDLRIAIKENDIHKMILSILKGADVNDLKGNDFPKAGKSMLAQAIDTGSLDAIKVLLKAGASVEGASDLPFDIGQALQTRWVHNLSYAIAVGAPLNIIEELVKYSKDLNIRDCYKKRTPYEVAQHYGRTDVMAILSKSKKSRLFLQTLYIKYKKISLAFGLTSFVASLL